jgi:predicted site-specific integrase-resolvase
VNLAGWAKKRGISRATAYAWFRAGELQVPARKVGGLILVGEHGDVPAGRVKTIVYARVSSADQRRDLDRQVARVTRWAMSQEHLVDEVVTEVGSALGGHRRKFLRLLRGPAVGRIIVEHRRMVGAAAVGPDEDVVV